MVHACTEVGAQSALAFVQFCENHGLLKLSNRPVWRTVRNGSQSYIAALLAKVAGTVSDAAGHPLHCEIF